MALASRRLSPTYYHHHHHPAFGGFEVGLQPHSSCWWLRSATTIFFAPASPTAFLLLLKSSRPAIPIAPAANHQEIHPAGSTHGCRVVAPDAPGGHGYHDYAVRRVGESSLATKLSRPRATALLPYGPAPPPPGPPPPSTPIPRPLGGWHNGPATTRSCGHYGQLAGSILAFRSDGSWMNRVKTGIRWFHLFPGPVPVIYIRYIPSDDLRMMMDCGGSPISAARLGLLDIVGQYYAPPPSASTSALPLLPGQPIQFLRELFRPGDKGNGSSPPADLAVFHPPHRFGLPACLPVCPSLWANTSVLRGLLGSSALDRPAYEVARAVVRFLRLLLCRSLDRGWQHDWGSWARDSRIPSFLPS
ncbi:hypothetical protein DFH27DRAFT_523830 [Peziza echinospora]|nr:hypothetical protein DFH27DRAFT_523830 [Peziza echinospora]